MIGNAAQVWRFHFRPPIESQHERRIRHSEIHESLSRNRLWRNGTFPHSSVVQGALECKKPTSNFTHPSRIRSGKQSQRHNDPIKRLQRCFFFGPSEVASLRSLVPKHLGRCTTFEVIIACTWRCRIRALQLDPDDGVRFIYTVNFTTKVNPPLPKGYYGNEFVLSAAVKTSRRLRENPLGYALELAKNVKSNVDEEYVLLDCVANCIRF